MLTQEEEVKQKLELMGVTLTAEQLDRFVKQIKEAAGIMQCSMASFSAACLTAMNAFRVGSNDMQNTMVAFARTYNNNWRKLHGLPMRRGRCKDV